MRLALAMVVMTVLGSTHSNAEAVHWRWPANVGATLSAGAMPLADMSVVQVNSDGTTTHATLSSRKSSGSITSEIWRVQVPPLDVLVDYEPQRDVPSMRLRLRVNNRSSQKVSACIGVQFDLAYPVDRATLFDFTKAPYVELAFKKDGMTGASWTAEQDLNTQMGLYGYPNRKTVYNCWGTVDLCNPLKAADPMASTLYIPAVSLYNAERGGLVVWSDPRSPFGFDGNHERLRVQHTFFLPAEKGAIDAGFEPGDGTGPWPYDFRVAYSQQPTWARLYTDFMATVPDLRQGHPAHRDAQIVALPRLTEEYVPIFHRLGIKYTGGNSVTYSYPDGLTREEIEWGRANGIYNWAQDGTIGMASDLEKTPVPIYEPQWIMERYESSLIKNSKGETEWCWQGKFANPSPAFPFGRDRLAALKELFKDPYRAFYIDLYLSGSGSDWAHPVDAMPFYPMDRAYYEYLSQVARETRKRGYFANINAPHPSCLVGKYFDWMTFDTDAPIWLMCRAYGEMTGVSVQFWTNLQDTPARLRASLSDALMYGIITGPYVSFSSLLPSQAGLADKDKATMLDLYARHYRLAYEIGRSKLVYGESLDGRPGPLIYYLSPEGIGYVTVQNLGKARRLFKVTIPRELRSGSRGHRLQYTVWSVDTGLTPQKPLPASSTVQVEVDAGMVSVIAVGPAGEEPFREASRQ